MDIRERGKAAGEPPGHPASGRVVLRISEPEPVTVTGSGSVTGSYEHHPYRSEDPLEVGEPILASLLCHVTAESSWDEPGQLYVRLDGRHVGQLTASQITRGEPAFLDGQFALWLTPGEHVLTYTYEIWPASTVRLTDFTVVIIGYF